MIVRVHKFRNKTKKSSGPKNSVTIDPTQLCGKMILQSKQKLIILSDCIFKHVRGYLSHSQEDCEVNVEKFLVRGLIVCKHMSNILLGKTHISL